jgi:hypothetical protein
LGFIERNNVNTEQVKSAVRWIIATFGPFIIAHGYATSGTLELAGGVIVSLAPLVWSMFTHTEQNAVAVVDTIAKNPDSAVKAVITEPTTAGKALADTLPGNTTVVAGTTNATIIAKATT